jgi:hypothetical protein
MADAEALSFITHNFPLMSESKERGSNPSGLAEIGQEPTRGGRPIRGARGRSRLDMLRPEEQQKIREYSRTASLKESVGWVKAEYNVDIGLTTLSAWLRRERRRTGAGVGRKIRPDSRLGMLKEEDQEKVAAYCEAVTLERGLTYLKKNYQLEVNLQTLSCWLKKRRTDASITRRLEKIGDDRDCAMLVGNVVGAATAMDEASTVLLSQAVFEELRKEPEERNEAHLKAYLTLLLKTRTVNLAEDRFRFNAAKRAMECAAGLNAIKGSETDERTKIERAIKLLFGERPEVDVTDPKVNAELNLNAQLGESAPVAKEGR